MGNLDGDVADEIVLGLGEGGGGWVQILDDAYGSWLQLLDWPSYVSTNGRVLPVCGDFDYDGKDEFGLATASDGWLQLRDDADTGFLPIGWRQLKLPGEAIYSGNTWPALRWEIMCAPLHKWRMQLRMSPKRHFPQVRCALRAIGVDG